MALVTGARLRSAESLCEVVVVKAPSTASDLHCAGVAMTAETVERSETSSHEGAPLILLGKRYGIESEGLEVLCVVAGSGPLVFEGVELTVKSAKPLPASD